MPSLPFPLPSRRPARPFGVVAALLLAVLAASAGASPRSALRAYTGDEELRGALERWRSRAEALQPRRVASPMAESAFNATAKMSAAPPAAAAAAVGKVAQDAAASDGITNVQTAGVDEGGIVKRAGDHLVILRRGRLFTVRIGGDALAPVSMVDAYAPGTDPQGAWYDELLISGSTVVVVGYSYARGGTEIGLFDLRTDGTLSYRTTWHLRSFDYFSSRNYASRLVGSRLVFYTPQLLSPWQAPLAESMPALRRWRDGGTPAAFERILPATRVYRTDDDFDPAQPLALHTVTACDLATRELQCESTAVLGPAGRVFYVSTGSVYVWTAQTPRRHWAWAPGDTASSAQSAVFRLPLDGAAPTALKTAGSPIDPLSFLEDDGGHLNVLLRDSGEGDAMWAAEQPRRGRLALLRVPLDDFGDGRQAAQRAHYRPLPPAPTGALQNRFVGDWLLWGAGGADEAFALRYAAPGGPAPSRLVPGHAVERIEALGAHALLVGNRGADLHLSAVRLGGGDAVLAGRHVQPGARQGETRTHGFFYRASGRSEGLLGLPVVAADGGAAPRRHGGASVAFVRQDDLDFTALGQLDARGARRPDDACKASCVDWYGNARPIFVGERIFALMGYELVEGRRVGGAWRERLVEHRRIDFTPAPALAGGRHWPFE